MKKKKGRRGAPPKGDAKQSHVVAVRLTEAEWRGAAFEAVLDGRPLAGMARMALLEFLGHRKSEREAKNPAKTGSNNSPAVTRPCV